MEYALIALLVLLNPIWTSAQKKVVRADSKEKKGKVAHYSEAVSPHNLYADVGLPFPGFSVTYNYKLAKHFSTGIGVQGYKFYRGQVDVKQFTPGVFGDIRLNIRPEKNNQFLTFLDLGMNFYKRDESYRYSFSLDRRSGRDSTLVYQTPHNNAFYLGLGLGYFRRMTERGGGPYISLKVISNWYTLKGYSIVSDENDITLSVAGGAIAFSLGFKF